MGRRLFLSCAACICCLVLASMAGGQENDAPGKPQRLRDLFEVQQTVILRTSQDSPLYTIRLLSDEQTKQVEELAAKEAEAERRMSSIDKLLEGEQGLEQLAALLKEQQDLTDSVASPSMRGESPYVVTHVGEDFVALRQGPTERFVPFGSIRYIYRSEDLTSTGPVASRRRPPRMFENASPRSLMIRLRNAEAGELADVLMKLYSGVDLKITADSRNNALVIEAPGAVGSSISILVEALEARMSAGTRSESIPGE